MHPTFYLSPQSTWICCGSYAEHWCILSIFIHCSQVSKKLLEGRELEFFKWEGDVEDLLKDVREKLNMLGEVYTRLLGPHHLCLSSAWFLLEHHLFWYVFFGWMFIIIAALVSWWEEQMLKRSNKVIPVYGADSSVNHLMKPVHPNSNTSRCLLVVRHPISLFSP